MGQKTLDSITIYLSWQDKQEIENEAREKNTSVSNLIRLKIGLPLLKAGRKKSEVYDNISGGFESSEGMRVTESSVAECHFGKTFQRNLFDSLGSEP